MRYFLSTLFILVAGVNAMGQDQNEIREGKVSFITTQSVYVKFSSMELISEGDTLYTKQGDTYVPALQIKNLSSISCVCNPLVTKAFKVSDAIYAKLDPGIIPDKIQEQVIMVPVQPPSMTAGDTLSGGTEKVDKPKQDISGRISVSSYSNLTSKDAARMQRMRYTFSLDANNLGNSGFSTETYVSFVHSNNNWDDVKENIFNGLKIYNLSIYQLQKLTQKPSWEKQKELWADF